MSFGRAGSDEQLIPFIARYPNADKASGPKTLLAD